MQPILSVELDTNLVVLGAAIQTTGLDEGDVGHDFKLGVEARSAVAAEEVTVDLAGGSLGVVGEWVTLGDLEVPAVDDDIGGVCTTSLYSVRSVLDYWNGAWIEVLKW